MEEKEEEWRCADMADLVRGMVMDSKSDEWTERP
jgi:hypothetical protein